MSASSTYRVNGETYYGTTPKFKLEIEAGIPMSDYDFDVRLVCGEKSLVVRKSDMPVSSGGDYYLCFDTTPLGVGRVKAVVTAYIPDSDFPRRIRREVYVVNNLLDIRGV